MSVSELDNPIWASLHGRHRDIALHVGEAVRFPAEFAPFLAVANGDCDAGGAIGSLVAADETVYLLGVAPRVSEGWSLRAYRPLAQMICADPIAMVDGPEAVALSEAHRADVLALTALVYPHYFRPRTIEMGRYFGIYRDGRLAAMIGERLGTGAHTEISAICTHPDFLGRGYARRLIALLTNDNLARGRMPFLHVSRENARALELYQRLGYRHRPDIGFWSLRREIRG
jgi:ribosomal protein S18 acetylase RimI-like enzyme